jgi:predicted nucleotidyltransferase
MQTLESVLGTRVNLAVLRYLSAVNGALSGNEIAKRLGLQQSSVRLALERLVEAGVVTRNDIGRSAAYQLDQRLAFVQTVLLPLFRAEAKLHERLLHAIARGCTKLKPRPHAVVVFGSAARGARDFRDVDLLCIATREDDKAPIHDGVADVFGQFQREFKVPISVVVATSGELRATRLEAVAREARRDGILVFGTAPADLSGVTGWKLARTRRQ